MKTYRKIILAGGTGQIGRALCRHFAPEAERIIVLSRFPQAGMGNITYRQWDGRTAGEWATELEGADLLVNLAGKNVNCRYTPSNREEILRSRTDSVKALAEAVSRCRVRPLLWIQLASATLYRHAEDRPMDEEHGEAGTGFSVAVCQAWERTFEDAAAAFPGMRKAILRTSMVLSREDGVLPRLKTLARSGLGGKQGNGRQWVSWIHEEDVCRMIGWIVQNETTGGIYNCTAPQPVKNETLMKLVREALGIRFGLPSPAWLLEAGALLIGTETELVLKSRWVLPARAANQGFMFRYPGLEDALAHLAR